LTTATDNTINLAPDYDIKIFKEVIFLGEKITVKKEVVSKADALLFPTAPQLTSITNVGIQNPVLDPTDTKLPIYCCLSIIATNGIYVLDMSIRPIITLAKCLNSIS